VVENDEGCDGGRERAVGELRGLGFAEEK